MPSLLMSPSSVGLWPARPAPRWTVAWACGVAWAASLSRSVASPGASSPASRGLRGMFRQTGGLIGVAGVVLALSFFPDQAQGLAVVFAVLAGVLLLAVPLVFLIPIWPASACRSHRRRGRGRSPPCRAANG